MRQGERGKMVGEGKDMAKPKPELNIQQSNSEREIGMEVEVKCLTPLSPPLLLLLPLPPSLLLPLPS